jgi:hypothetical protein
MLKIRGRSRNGGMGIKENDGEGESTITYYIHFCKCHSAPQYNNNMKILKVST